LMSRPSGWSAIVWITPSGEGRNRLRRQVIVLAVEHGVATGHLAGGLGRGGRARRGSCRSVRRVVGQRVVTEHAAVLRREMRWSSPAGILLATRSRGLVHRGPFSFGADRSQRWIERQRDDESGHALLGGGQRAFRPSTATG
jgi:hypothetical protein